MCILSAFFFMKEKNRTIPLKKHLEKYYSKYLSNRSSGEPIQTVGMTF
jgi:hypothetical protein